ncbi:MAG: hypothetical protein ACK5C0_00240 [Candidatus Kapaibacterium sp.]|jgi:hypothetical protein
MKHIFLIFAIIFLLGCGSDDAPTNMNTASRSVADYMFDGPVGTQYWMSQERTLTDADGKTQLLHRDTTVITILHRAYNHPILGNCLLTGYQLSPSVAGFIDTLYFGMSNNTIVAISNTETIQKLFNGPIEQGSLQDVGELGEGGEGMSKIHALDVPITTPVGNFSTIHVRTEISYAKTKVIYNKYFSPGVFVPKMEELYDRINWKGAKELEKVTSELVKVQTP